ncbi:TBC domain-containing protein kinase-like protein [Trichonephila clavipes]|nr:TBC domain-containing protein kinase-like protein [Trichonephila clavipes]
MLWGRQVAGRNYPPTNKNTLIRALTEEWDKLPQQLLDNVVQIRPEIQNSHGKFISFEASDILFINVERIITCEGEEFGHEKDQAFLLDDSVSILPLEPLKHRLRDVDYDIYYPLIEYSLNGISPSSFFATLKDTSKLPLVIKEKDVEYQNLCSIVRINSSTSKEALKALNRKRGAVKVQLTRIKNFMNNPDEKDKTHLESKLDTLKSLRIKLSDIRVEYYEVVADDSDLEPLESEILDLEDDSEDIYISR